MKEKEILMEVINYLAQQPYYQVHKLISNMASLIEDKSNEEK